MFSRGRQFKINIFGEIDKAARSMIKQGMSSFLQTVINTQTRVYKD
jgi:hypothetical protein